MSYVDGFIVPVPHDSKEQYRAMAQKMAGKLQDLGATQVLEGWGDDLSRGKVTDFYMAVKAEDGENVVFSYIVWPDKQTRDKGWDALQPLDLKWITLISVNETWSAFSLRPYKPGEERQSFR